MGFSLTPGFSVSPTDLIVSELVELVELGVGTRSVDRVEQERIVPNNGPVQMYRSNVARMNEVDPIVRLRQQNSERCWMVIGECRYLAGLLADTRYTLGRIPADAGHRSIDRIGFVGV